jgi:hypothetical protein
MTAPKSKHTSFGDNVVTYATPTTYTEFVSLIDGIEEWPTDCNQQAGAFYDLIARINALEQGWVNLQGIHLHVVQDAQPNLNDWQTAWEKAGYTLPITGNVYGLHESQTLSEREVGEYIWYDGKMQPAHARYWQGSSEITKPFYAEPADGALTGSVTTTEAKKFDLPVSMKAAGWVLFHMAVSVGGGTYLAWRTNFEAAAAQYRMVAPLHSFLQNDLYYFLDYRPRARQATPYVGNIEIWASAGANATFNTSYLLKHLNTLPGWMELIYD